MFTYKGITSEEMGLIIGSNITYTSPSRDIEFVEVQGRDGDIAIDRGRYSSVTRSIPVMLKDPDSTTIANGRTVEEMATDITDWLLTDVGYHEFLWDEEPDYVFKAMIHQGYSLERVLSTFGRAILTFRFHPIKYDATGLQERAVTNNSTISNPYGIEAKPKLTLVGTGNMTVNIGDQQLVLQNVDKGIIVDSESQTVTSLDGQRTQFDKVYSYPLPVLKPGNNVISFTGAESLSMITRLGALI